MSKDLKMKATPVYDYELEAWIINVNANGETMPIGKTINEGLQLFEYCKYESREKAIEWIKQKENLYCSEVKFYAFNDYEYSALIVVDAEEKYPMGVAIEAYKEEVADYDEEITLEEALERYKKGNIEGCNTEAAKIIDFYERIDLDIEHEQDYTILLMDSSLC